MPVRSCSGGPKSTRLLSRPAEERSSSKLLAGGASIAAVPNLFRDGPLLGAHPIRMDSWRLGEGNLWWAPCTRMCLSRSWNQATAPGSTRHLEAESAGWASGLVFRTPALLGWEAEPANAIEADPRTREVVAFGTLQRTPAKAPVAAELLFDHQVAVVEQAQAVKSDRSLIAGVP